MQLNDGTFRVDLSSLATTDLSWVAGLPISEIDLHSARVTDISPLSGLPLRKVSMHWTGVSDLRPLHGKPITDLQLHWTGVSDLSPLAGMPLENLSLAACVDVEDLGPLAGMPLKELLLSRCLKVKNFSPLAQCTRLERLALPSGFQDVGLLRKLPNLKQVLLSDSGASFDWDSVPPVTEFLPFLEQRVAQDTERLKDLRAALIRLGMSKDRAALVGVSAFGGMSLDLSEYPIADLSILKGLRIRELFLNSINNQFSDLSPLEGMPVWNIGITGSRTTNLSSLYNSPLGMFRVENCPSLKDVTPLRGHLLLFHVALEYTGVKDLRPLGDCPNLQEVFVTGSPVSDIAPLTNAAHLQEFGAAHCPLKDLSPLEKLVELKDVQLDESLVEDLQPLRNMNLRVLKINGTSVASFAPLAKMTAMEYLLARGTPVRDLVPLAKLTSMIHLDVQISQAENLPEIPGSKLRILKIAGTRITNFAPLKNFTELEDLSATSLPIADLSVLSNCGKMRMLYIGNIPATDIRPICGFPLNTLFIDGSQIADIAPLANCKTLEHLLLPKGAKGVEALRNHPRLQRLSYTWDDKAFRVSQTVKEFWAEYDKKENKQ